MVGDRLVPMHAVLRRDVARTVDARMLRDLVAQLEPLVDEAERVIDGDADAAARWRLMLAWDRDDDLSDASPDLAGAGAPGTLDPDSVQSLWAATAMAAHNVRQLEAMSHRLNELLAPAVALAQLAAAPVGPRRTLMATGMPGMPGLPGVGSLGAGSLGGGWPGGGGPGGGGPGGGGRPPRGRGPRLGDVVWPGVVRAPVTGRPDDVLDIDSAFELWQRLFRPGQLDPRVPCGALEVILGLRARREAGDYDITALEPRDACVGEALTVHGSNFKPGLETSVVFTGAQGPVGSPSLSVTATEIRAVVPAGAVAGPVRVRTVLSTVEACGRLHPVTQRGDSATFTGGEPGVTRLVVNGRENDCWATGPTATVEWSLVIPPPDNPVLVAVGPATPVTIRVTDANGTQTHSSVHDWPMVDTVPVPLPQGQRWVTISAEYTGRCGRAQRQVQVWLGSPGRPDVAGIEVTQGIQEHVRVTEAWSSSDRSRWNSLELVAGKPTVVRVFPIVQYEPPGAHPRPFDMSAELRMLNTVTGAQVGPSLTPLSLGSDGALHAGVRVKAGGWPPDRRRTADSFNFHVPAGYATGELDLQVRLTVTAGSSVQTVTRTHRARWRSKAPLNVHYVRVFGKGGGPTPLSDLEARQAVMAGLELLPFPVLRVAPSPHAVLGNDEIWTVKDGNERLVDELIEIGDDYADTRYVGIVNTAVPSPGLSGTADRPTGDRMVCWATREPIVVAHEVTHLFGFHDVSNLAALQNVPFDIPRMTTLHDLVQTDNIVDFMEAKNPVASQGGLPIRPIAVSEATWKSLANDNSPW